MHCRCRERQSSLLINNRVQTNNFQGIRLVVMAKEFRPLATMHKHILLSAGSRDSVARQRHTTYQQVSRLFYLCLRSWEPKHTAGSCFSTEAEGIDSHDINIWMIVNCSNKGLSVKFSMCYCEN